MTIWKGVFDAEAVKPGVYDTEANKWGLWDAEYVAVAVSTAFDQALMAAIARHWPDIVFDTPQVVASGMAPPAQVKP